MEWIMVLMGGLLLAGMALSMAAVVEDYDRVNPMTRASIFLAGDPGHRGDDL